MRKIFLTILVLSLLFSLNSCNTLIKENTKEHGTSPSVYPYNAKTTEEMIQWINTVYAENFAVHGVDIYKGQFKHSIPRIREEGYILVPKMDGENIELRMDSGISIYPVVDSDKLKIVYHACVSETNANIIIYYIDEGFANTTQKGIDEYFKQNSLTNMDNWNEDKNIKNMYLEDREINGVKKQCRITEYEIDSHIIYAQGNKIICIIAPTSLIIDGEIDNISFEAVNLNDYKSN